MWEGPAAAHSGHGAGQASRAGLLACGSASRGRFGPWCEAYVGSAPAFPGPPARAAAE